MNAKQYLKQAYRLNELIESNQEELTALRESASSIPGIDYSKDKIQSGSVGDAGFTNIVAKIIEIENSINADINKLFDLKLQIRTVINSVENNEERLLLHDRYINFYTWEQVCEKMNISLRTAHRIHSIALSNVKVPS